ncbi:OmpA family protein [Planktotalea sp.]|uniref:OmpA family protein n=1 Tax=Planktotalea sp. TaxID=2029877 RepID=UPI003D6A2988
MIVKFLKDHLPWLAPSAAIVFAASGFFDRSSGTSETAQPVATALAQNELSDFSKGSNFNAQAQADVVTRLSTVTGSSLELLKPKPAAQLEVAVARAIEPKAAEVVAPTPVPVKEEKRVAALQTTENANAFFADAQAKLAAQKSCVGDLRAFAEQARVYFPAGGLNADIGGMEQARLLGSLTQTCKGVKIVVEGHSDPSGNAEVNLRLSKKRAEHVIQRLGASGFDTSNFIAQGLGSQKPSKVIGPKSSAFYDRRVEFVIIETGSDTGFVNAPATNTAWASSDCVADLRNAISNTQIFYAPRSVAAKPSEVSVALELASKAMACPNARLRVIGQHSDALRAGESHATGRLRAKALMAVLVGQGIDSGQIIIAAPSRSKETASLSGSRLDFDIIVE